MSKNKSCKADELVKSGNPPNRYKQKPLQNLIWKNITAHVRYSYNFSFRDYTDSFARGLITNCHLSEDDVESKVKNLERQYNGYGNRLFSDDMISWISKALLIPEDALWTEKEPRDVNYILLEVNPKFARDIYHAIVEMNSPYIDEVAVVTGQYAIFIRMFGPSQAVAEFNFELLKIIDPKNHVLRSTSMRGFMSDGLVYERYPNASHPHRNPKPPSWLPEGWVAP